MSQRKKAFEIVENIQKVIEGKEVAIWQVLICLLAKGHVLIEDVPGVGKTTLVKALSKSLHLSYGRIQFTPDLMPSDITGSSTYDREKNEFRFVKGPVFNQIILADEINRTSPKTQSSLLQAMAEQEVSVDGQTYPLVSPFMVLATQNPMGHQGTFPLPESQMDRFMMRVSLGYPDEKSEKKIIQDYGKSKNLDWLKPVSDGPSILEMQAEVQQVKGVEEIHQFIVNILNATRRSQDISLGLSPRAGIDLFKGAQVRAYLKGRDYVVPDDIKEILMPVIAHRLILSSEAKIEKKSTEKIIQKALGHISVPVVSPRES